MRKKLTSRPSRSRSFQTVRIAALFALALGLSVSAADAQRRVAPPSPDEQLVNLDFDDVELTVVVDTIAKVTGKNFIYDDRVRGRVTILSPAKVTVDQAYAVFESVLKVKGFTAVPGPANVLKIIPIRDAKESNIETVKGDRQSRDRDLFVTRLIPLLYIDATEITTTIKPLVSKDASIIAYAPTNMIILTDTASNIRRLLSILEAIDVTTHREELAVIKIRHADAQTLGTQVSEIYGADVSGSSSSRSSRSTSSSRRTSSRTPTPAAASAGSAGRSRVRIITDDRTNSLLVLAARSQLEDIRNLVKQLDVPIVGQGRIHVYYLKHSDAEELSQTLNGLLSGQPRAAASPGRTGAAGASPALLRSQITEFASGITITADPATNSLVIQASKEAYETLVKVVEQLDIPRPQVLVEALIMEVDITEGMQLGVDAIYKVSSGDSEFIFNTGKGIANIMGADSIDGVAGVVSGMIERDANGRATEDGFEMKALITATATDARFNILSAPHVLTSDNEEAEIQIGNNIPIVTSRVQSAAGVETGLSTSQNIERQDIGVTLRVTPQISEGDTLRLKIFQEITEVNSELTEETGSATESGVAIRKRTVENTVVVNNQETVVIGGLISEATENAESKVPWLGDIPVLGVFFRTTDDKSRKINLLVFLTPHIIRGNDDLIGETIRKRQELIATAIEGEEETETAMEDPKTAVQQRLKGHADDYPLERMEQITQTKADDLAERQRLAALQGPRRHYEIIAGVFRDETSASSQLTRLLDAGFDAILVSGSADGQLVYELRVGPYEEVEQAEKVALVLHESYELRPAVKVTRVDLEEAGQGEVQ